MRPSRRIMLGAAALLCAGAAAARTDVTFILADDNPGHAFFAAARDYYAARPAEAGVFVTSARTLADVREFLRRSPLAAARRGALGPRAPRRARLAMAGAARAGVRRRRAREPASPGAGARARRVSAAAGRTARSRQPSRRRQLRLARRPRWLQRLAELFAGATRVPVEASAGYVWFRRLRGVDGGLQSRREELPHRAVVIAGMQALDETVRARLRRGWPADRGVQFVAVLVRIDVPAPAAGDGRQSASPEALAAVRNYGLRWSQLQWRTEAGLLRGSALLAVAAPDIAAEELRELAAAP